MVLPNCARVCLGSNSNVAAPPGSWFHRWLMIKAMEFLFRRSLLAVALLSSFAAAAAPEFRPGETWLDVDGAVGTIRLDRPPMNAINGDLLRDLREVADEAAANDDVRSLVLYGGENVFAAGADIKMMAGLAPTQQGEPFLGLAGTPPPMDPNEHFQYPRIIPVKDGEVAQPSAMLAMGDGFYRTGTKIKLGFSGIGIDAYPLPGSDDTTRALRRHERRGNVGFCDGHVKWFKWDRFNRDASAVTTGTYANYPKSPYMQIGP